MTVKSRVCAVSRTVISKRSPSNSQKHMIGSVADRGFATKPDCPRLSQKWRLRVRAQLRHCGVPTVRSSKSILAIRATRAVHQQRHPWEEIVADRGSVSHQHWPRLRGSVARRRPYANRPIHGRTFRRWTSLQRRAIDDQPGTHVGDTFPPLPSPLACEASRPSRPSQQCGDKDPSDGASSIAPFSLTTLGLHTSRREVRLRERGILGRDSEYGSNLPGLHCGPSLGTAMDRRHLPIPRVQAVHRSRRN